MTDSAATDSAVSNFPPGWAGLPGTHGMKPADRYLHGAYHPSGHCPNGVCAEQRPIPCMDDCCRDADRCVWACEGRYYVPGADDDD